MIYKLTLLDLPPHNAQSSAIYVQFNSNKIPYPELPPTRVTAIYNLPSRNSEERALLNGRCTSIEAAVGVDQCG